MISIVSNSYYEMLWGQIHIHLPSEHPIMSFQTIEIKMAALSAKRFMENNKYFFAEASGGEIKKLVDNSSQRNTKKIHKIYRNDLRAFALRNYSEIIQNFTVAFEASLLRFLALFIFRTIFQPWAISSDIPAAERGSFTKDTYVLPCKPVYCHVSPYINMYCHSSQCITIYTLVCPCLLPRITHVYQC